jgi:hypothetical protein
MLDGSDNLTVAKVQPNANDNAYEVNLTTRSAAVGNVAENQPTGWRNADQAVTGTR